MFTACLLMLCVGAFDAPAKGGNQGWQATNNSTSPGIAEQRVTSADVPKKDRDPVLKQESSSGSRNQREIPDAERIMEAEQKQKTQQATPGKPRRSGQFVSEAQFREMILAGTRGISWDPKTGEIIYDDGFGSWKIEKADLGSDVPPSERQRVETDPSPPGAAFAESERKPEQYPVSAPRISESLEENPWLILVVGMVLGAVLLKFWQLLRRKQ